MKLKAFKGEVNDAVVATSGLESMFSDSPFVFFILHHAVAHQPSFFPLHAFIYSCYSNLVSLAYYWLKTKEQRNEQKTKTKPQTSSIFAMYSFCRILLVWYFCLLPPLYKSSARGFLGTNYFFGCCVTR